MVFLPANSATRGVYDDGRECETKRKDRRLERAGRLKVRNQIT